MPRSHHCGRCGEDLTRVRALREPVYGFPLVRCGSCGLATVRRVHPFERAAHRWRVADLGLGLFVTQLVAFAAATVAACLISALASRLMLGFVDVATESGRLAIIFTLGGALAVGAWLAVAFGHLRLLIVAPAFLVWVMLCIALPFAFDVIDPIRWQGLAPALLGLREAGFFMIGAVAIAPIAGIGIPIGAVARRAARWGYGALRRRALRRARRRKGVT